jgi:hypothetical protein
MSCLLKIIGLLLVVVFFFIYAFYADEMQDNMYGVRAYSQTEVDYYLVSP